MFDPNVSRRCILTQRLDYLGHATGKGDILVRGVWAPEDLHPEESSPEAVLAGRQGSLPQ
jgi:hypothetical protein